jgi:hypothetical protein
LLSPFPNQSWMTGFSRSVNKRSVGISAFDPSPVIASAAKPTKSPRATAKRSPDPSHSLGTPAADCSTTKQASRSASDRLQSFHRHARACGNPELRTPKTRRISTAALVTV